MSQAAVSPQTEVNTDFDPKDVDINGFDIAVPEYFRDQKHWGLFDRLRKEDPVHFAESPEFGPYWSVTKYKDIVAVDTNHKQFSSEPAIVITDPEPDFNISMFIAMDQPKHDVQRKVVSPAVAPPALADLEPMIRERVAKVLDDLPVGETFNWVDRVSIEITTQMLATLFDFPMEDRRKLTWWSDVSTAGPDGGDTGLDEEQRREVLRECLETFAKMLGERKQQEPKNDFISLMAHHPQMSKMEPMELLGNLILLIVGGNDTTRNSMSGGVLALNQFPEEYDKLRKDPSVIPNMVSEIIRWRTPLAYMRRTALEDVELGGKTIKKGDKVLMWYVSGNRDEDDIEDPYRFQIDRPQARKHLAFGFGIHRCMGNRMAELQIRILWEEIMKRFDFVEVVGEPQYTRSTFVHGITELPVRVHPKK